MHAGEVVHETKDRNRSQDFVAFLQRRDAVTPLGLTLHIVLDNGSSHAAKDTKTWLADPARQDRFVVHHTPTHASWLN